METPTYIALSRQMGLRRHMDIVANNIANMNTPAYKAERLIFVEYLQNKEAANNQDKLSFAQDIGTLRDTSEGPLIKTDNPFDLAVSGEGYFTIETPLGDRYTRHGRFQLDAENRLVTGQGNPVLDDGGQQITIAPGSGRITIGTDGTLSTNDGVIAKFGLVQFADEQQLKRGANNLYNAPDELQPAAVDKPRIIQGMLEESNVQAVTELTRMIDVLRTHQSIGKAIEREHERQMKAITKLGRQAQMA